MTMYGTFPLPTDQDFNENLTEAVWAAHRAITGAKAAAYTTGLTLFERWPLPDGSFKQRCSAMSFPHWLTADRKSLLRALGFSLGQEGRLVTHIFLSMERLMASADGLREAVVVEGLCQDGRQGFGVIVLQRRKRGILWPKHPAILGYSAANRGHFGMALDEGLCAEFFAGWAKAMVS